MGQLYVSNFYDPHPFIVWAGSTSSASSRTPPPRSKPSMARKPRVSGRRPSRIHSIAAFPTTTRGKNRAPLGPHLRHGVVSTSTRAKSTALAITYRNKAVLCSRLRISMRRRVAKAPSSNHAIGGISLSRYATSGSVRRWPGCSATCSLSRINKPSWGEICR